APPRAARPLGIARLAPRAVLASFPGIDLRAPRVDVLPRHRHAVSLGRVKGSDPAGPVPGAEPMQAAALQGRPYLGVALYYCKRPGTPKGNAEETPRVARGRNGCRSAGQPSPVDVGARGLSSL